MVAETGLTVVVLHPLLGAEMIRPVVLANDARCRVEQVWSSDVTAARIEDRLVLQGHGKPADLNPRELRVRLHRRPAVLPAVRKSLPALRNTRPRCLGRDLRRHLLDRDEVVERSHVEHDHRVAQVGCVPHRKGRRPGGAGDRHSVDAFDQFRRAPLTGQQQSRLRANVMSADQQRHREERAIAPLPREPRRTQPSECCPARDCATRREDGCCLQYPLLDVVRVDVRRKVETMAAPPPLRSACLPPGRSRQPTRIKAHGTDQSRAHLLVRRHLPRVRQIARVWGAPPQGRG